MKPLISKLLPPNTRRRRTVARLARKVGVLKKAHPDVHYAEWVERTEPYSWSEKNKLKYQPVISIVVPLFNTPSKYLLPMVYSVVNQQDYQNWELVLVNASTDKDSRQLAQRCAQIDNRIKVVEIEKNEGIAGNTRLGIKKASGEYIALLDHDDVLTPRALYEVGLALQQKPRPQFVYSDEDKISEDGEYRYDPFFKPDWSPFLFRQVNYLNHLAVIDKKLIEEAGGYREGFEGAQDYDLFLRLVDRKPIIAHVPKVLYHWRAAIGSTAHNFESKKNITEAGTLALAEHLSRNKQKGKIQPLLKQPGFYSIDYEPVAGTRIGLLILPTKITEQYIKLAETLIKSLKHTKIQTDIFVQKIGQLKFATNNERLQIHYLEANSKEQFIKQALEQSSAGALIFINTALKPLNELWADRLAGLITQVKNVGVATPLIIDKAAKLILDAGYVGQNDQLISLFQWLPIESNTYIGNTIWGRDIDQPSNRVVAVRRETYENYFKNGYPAIGGGNTIYENMRTDQLEVVVDTSVMVDFVGDLEPLQRKTRYYNPNVVSLRRGVSMPKTINVPPEIDT